MGFKLPDAKRQKIEEMNKFAPTPLRDHMNINQDLFAAEQTNWEKSSFASGIGSHVGAQATFNLKAAFE